MISQIIFGIIFLFSVGLFTYNIRRLIKQLNIGKGEWPKDSSSLRWKRLFLNALGQKKMFKRPLPAILHFFVYAGFIIINIEILEIIIDGLTGSHRIVAPIAGLAYAPFISFFEILALLVLISCLIFLARRNLVKVPRLNMYELTKWPRLDANIILITEVALMTAFLSMNACDHLLQDRAIHHYTATGNFAISSLITPLFQNLSTGQLIFIERSGWWFHILGIFAFLNYLPISKHLHILFAFPNSYYANLKLQSKIENMPDVEREVQLMMNPSATPAEPAGEPGRFGAKDVNDLKKTDILGAFSCTECGRCTAVCPANITGKLLSPRKIMMDTRDRCEEVGKNNMNFDDGKSLLGDYITHEEIMACTTCQACVEACPVNIDPLSIIVQLRRYVTMEEAKTPANWNVMFGNIENNAAPWQFSPNDRFNWAEELKNEESK